MGSDGAQNGSRNRPSGAQNLQISSPRAALFALLKPTCSQDRFWSAPAPILVDLGCIFDEMSMKFGIISEISCCSFYSHFLQRTCREPARNLQEMQRTFRELATTRQTNLKITNGILRLFLPASCFKMVSFHGQRPKVSAVALPLQSTLGVSFWAKRSPRSHSTQ